MLRVNYFKCQKTPSYFMRNSHAAQSKASCVSKRGPSNCEYFRLSDFANSNFYMLIIALEKDFNSSIFFRLSYTYNCPNPLSEY